MIIENIPLSCLIKEISVLSISITCPIRIAIYHLKYFILQLVLKFYIGRAITDLVNMVKCVVGLLLVQMKKQGIEFTCNISLLERMFLKHFNVFHNFPDTTDEFIKSFFLFLHTHLCMYTFIYLCVYVLQCIYLCCSF